MRIKFCNNKIWKVKSEKGFTFLELIFVISITGILSSTLILPFISNLKEGTDPEVYATATYLAMAQIEKIRSEGHSYAKDNYIGTTTDQVFMVNRTYDVQIVVGFVTHSGTSFSDPPVVSPASEFIKAIVTLSHADIPNDVEIWTILANDHYNPDANI